MALRSRTVQGLVVGSLLLAATQACGQPAASRQARTVGAASGEDEAWQVVGPAPAAVLQALKATDLCALQPTRRTALPNAAPFAPVETKCIDDPFCDFVEKAPPGADACYVAQDNLRRAERDSAAATVTPVASTPWNGAPPKFLDRIDAHYHLTASENRTLAQNGFVVLDRAQFPSYAAAFHDVFQQQLPLYVAMDPVYHAVFKGTELVLARIERRELKPALTRMLRALRRGVREAGGRYSAETLADVATYVRVADELADDDYHRQNKLELTLALERGEGLETVSLFGRERVVDFSQFVPRGHYTDGEPGEKGGSLVTYFRALQWLSRLEFNLVSRGCASSAAGAADCRAETPREARAAMALAEIAQRAGADVELRRFERVYATFGGAREDVSPTALRELMQTAGITAGAPEAPAALKAAIGPRFARTAATHFRSEGTGALPVIATLVGLRVPPDTGPLTSLVHDTIEDRKTMSPGGEVGYLLGHDAAKTTLARDLISFPGLAAALDTGRQTLRTQTERRDDVYGTWLRAILALGEPPRGAVPSFYAKPAFASRRMESALVAYGQLRHTFVLLAAQGYDSYGCEIPDAYVEPELAALDRLMEHVQKLRTLSGPKTYAGLLRSLDMLRRIAGRELSGAALPEADRRWLGMVSEYVPTGGYAGDSGEPPKWTGWYYDMFEDREHGALESAAFVADYFTMTNHGTSETLGAEAPRLGVFVVDVGGEPRAMVGPVAKGYAASVPLEKGRATDEAPPAPELRAAPWRTPYAASEATTMPGDLDFVTVACPGPTPTYRVVLAAREDVGVVKVELLDHHGDALGQAIELSVGSEPVIASFALPDSFDRTEKDEGFGLVMPGGASTPKTELAVDGVQVHVKTSWLRRGSEAPADPE